ncbi:MAG: addiction module antidote protein [Litorimonas sp.]
MTAPDHSGTIDVSSLAPFRASDMLDTPEAVAEFLTAALEGGDMKHFARAVGEAARSVGMSEMSRRTGMDRNNLYRRLSGESVPKVDTLLTALSGLGLGLAVVPLQTRGET